MVQSSIFRIRSLRMLLLICVLVNGWRATAQDTASRVSAIGSSRIWGTVDGIQIEGLVQGPTGAVAGLQVACIFEYTEGDIFNDPALPAALNGMVHLDEALKGLITEIRRTGRFAGHVNETILITPPAGTIAAKKLLLIGLGDRNTFESSQMTGVGAVAMREALTLGATSLAFASDIKDAGVNSATAQVAENVTRGMIDAYRTQQFLKRKKMASFRTPKKLILLAGPAFFNEAGEGIQRAISLANLDR